MSLPAAIADLLPDLVAVRRDLHAHPELAFAEHRTAAIVAAALKALGLEVHAAVGGTGVVGVLRKGGRSGAVGLRADMDALPIVEAKAFAHASTVHGLHHACGHDGHTSMLGAARRPAHTRRFDGTVNFIFQPTEEGRGGARAMVERFFDRFPCDAVYALHNWPGLPLGSAQTRSAPDHGCGRPVRYHRARPRRPCGATAHHARRHSCGERADDAVADADVAPHRTEPIGRAVDHAHRRGAFTQRAARDGGANGYRAHLRR